MPHIHHPPYFVQSLVAPKQMEYNVYLFVRKNGGMANPLVRQSAYIHTEWLVHASLSSRSS